MEEQKIDPLKVKADQAKFHGIEMTKDTIAEWLDRDLEGLLSLLFAIKHSEMVKNVLVEWLYENHVAFKMNKAAAERKEAKKEMEKSIQEGEGYAVQ